MRSFKKLLSFTSALLVLLLSIAVYVMVKQTVENYKNKIIHDYSIVLVSTIPLEVDNIRKLGGVYVKSIEVLRKDAILYKYKDKLSSKTFKVLKTRLPYFYNIFLDDFPTTQQLKTIKLELLQIKGVKSIELFSKNHTKIYSTLKITQNISSILVIAIFIYAILIFSKQIRIWSYEQSEKIEIMKLHGATIFYTFKPIIKIATFATIISIIIGIGFAYIIKENIGFFIGDDLANLFNSHFDMTDISLYMTISAIFVSFLTTIITMIISSKQQW
jgi:cell division transport system permease protein